MDAIRLRARASNGSLYHHFPTKSLLADALYADILRHFQRAMMAPLQENVSAEDGVRGFVHAYVRWVERNPGHARLLHDLRSSGAVRAGAGEWSEVNAQGFGALRTWVQQRVATGEMLELPLSVWMALVLGPAMSLTSHWVGRPTHRVASSVTSALARGAWRAVAADANVQAPELAIGHRAGGAGPKGAKRR